MSGYVVEKGRDGRLNVREAGEWPVIWYLTDVRALERLVELQEQIAREKVQSARALRAAYVRYTHRAQPEPATPASPSVLPGEEEAK